MSFMAGGTCAANSNPLAQLAKQHNTDHSLQHERNAVYEQRGSMRSANRPSETDQMLMQKFKHSAAPNFRFDELQSELNLMQAPQRQPQIQRHQNQLNQPQLNQQQPSEWASEFHAPQAQTMPSRFSHMGYGMNSMSMPSMSGMSMPMGMMRSVPQAQAQNQNQKPEIDDATWEQHFKSIEQVKETKEVIEPVLEPLTVSAEEFMDEKEIGIEDGYDPKWFENNQYPEGWDEVWDRIKDQMVDDSTSGGHIRAGNIWDRDFDEFSAGRPQFADYKFSENNPYLGEDDPFALGVTLMDQGAKLSLAVLCFEAVLQRNPSHVEAWGRLGAAQAQNELEDEAIRALEQCVKLDPKNEQALLNLGVSYINEGYENAAYATLERWLATKYPHLVNLATMEEPALANENRLELHKRVTGLFLKAAQMSPNGANMDADVQVGLGVLFYGNEEYNKAVDCFRAGLSVRSEDPLLWNRLGATLANSNRPEEAIDAYYKALELRPSFVRARYNVAVSCINIGCYREAAQHLLSAISLHQTSQDGPNFEKSTNLCETLRRVFLAMDRRDLLPKVGPAMNLDEFRADFTF